MSVDRLARELGVSQTPIKEALGRLEGEGLVVHTHMLGYRAAPQLTEAQFRDLYDLRLTLEPQAAARAAMQINDEQLQALAELVHEMRTPGHNVQSNYGHFAKADAAFHDKLLAIAGNMLVREIFAKLHIHMHLYRLMYHASVTADVQDEHEAIICALRRRDPAETQRLMRKHIEGSQQRFVDLLQFRG
jgi:DNA-binding GntR family transcriptional regulator